MKLKIICIIALSLFVLTSCQKAAKTEVETPKVDKAATNELSDVKVDFSTSTNEVRKDEQTELSFTVKKQNGEVIKDLKVAHEKLMHVLIVSADLSEFYHIHPDMQSDGTFREPFAFPNGGNYKLYIDITLADGRNLVKTADVSVKGEIPKAEKLAADEKFEQLIAGLRVSMKPDREILAGKEISLGFDVIDIATKKPATDMQNYLGEKAHFVVISENLLEFVHAHPMSMTAPGAHSEHSEGNGKMPEMNSEAFVSAHITFPEPGLYKLWAQFQRNGRVIDVPFVINVKPDKEQAKLEAKADIPKDAYRITVGKEGFTPSDVSFAAGEFRKLAFVRIDSENCADEIVFKDLNITKKLPVGEIVYVDLPGDSKGKTYSFACGMNMLKGKVVVQ